MSNETVQKSKKMFFMCVDDVSDTVIARDNLEYRSITSHMNWLL